MADSAAVDVSVLIPVLNEERFIEGAADAMRAQDLDGTFELIFIDGASEDRTRELLEARAAADPVFRVLDNPARSTPVALNIGLRAARGRIVARMDAHTFFPPDYLSRGVARLAAGDVAHVSGPSVPYGTDTWSRRVALALDTRFGTGGAGFRHATDEEIEVDSGFVGMWKRSTLEEQGGWDEDWPNDQDSELAARIRQSGGRIVCLPQMAARYVPRDSLRALARQYYKYGRYRAKTSGRHPETMRRSHVVAPALVTTLAAATVLRGRWALLPRLGVAGYAAALALVTAREAGSHPAGDVASLPLVFATMHLAWGAGFIVGSVQFGPPLEALMRVLGLRRGA